VVRVYVVFANSFSVVFIFNQIFRCISSHVSGRCGRDRMVIGFITTYANSAYHH